MRRVGRFGFGTELKRHVDRFLGAEPNQLDVDDVSGLLAARFDEIPDPGMLTTISVGLSAHPLTQAGAGSAIRQEVLMTASSEFSSWGWSEVLLAAGQEALANGKAFLRGQVLGPRGPLFGGQTGCHMTALLCTPPLFFDDEFCQFDVGSETVVFVELVPITTAEAKEISSRGWSQFFDKISAGSVDVLDVWR